MTEREAIRRLAADMLQMATSLEIWAALGPDAAQRIAEHCMEIASWSRQPRIQVAQVPPGSVILLSGVDFGSPDIEINFAEEIAACIGHRAFALIVAGDSGDVEVWGPDTDLKAKIDELLNRQEEQ